MRQEIVFCDLETGGLDAKRHQVIQIAAVAVYQDMPMEKRECFEVKVQLVDGWWEQQALDVNSYDPVVWAQEAIPGRQALERFSRFLRDHSTVEKVGRESGKQYRVARLGGHNFADFDLRFLAEWYEREKMFPPFARHCSEVVDTIHGARWLAVLSGIEFKSMKLADVCNGLAVPLGDAHDAKVDVMATLDVAREIGRRMSQLKDWNATMALYQGGGRTEEV